jgi:hypothetical protein
LPNGWIRLNTGDAKAAKAEYDADKSYLNANPKVKQYMDAAAAEYRQYNAGLLDFAAQCDFLTPEEATRLKRVPYVPYYRVEDGVVKLFVEDERPIRIGNIKDNPDLQRDDPGYEKRLEGLGNKELVRAYRHGDWNILAGAFFDILREDKHRLRRFVPPKHWTRYLSMDWGSAKPFSVGWWVIVEENIELPGQDGQDIGERLAYLGHEIPGEAAGGIPADLPADDDDAAFAHQAVRIALGGGPALGLE